MADEKIYIQINETGINYSFKSYYRKEENGMYSWHIPAYNLFFSSDSVEKGTERGRKMVRSFYSFWIKQQGFKNFLLEIHKLGFRIPTNHDYNLMQMLNRKIHSAKFKAPQVLSPINFNEAVEQEGQLEMAI
ncbi:MAG: hypothetical protein B7Y11_01240 [Sphingobacteriia bacterium 24-36-13]|jgi:hypothetical protein|uniref:hypothetical protein n=1 Tax=Sediminibacterium sp. TaxID=1917865 RepID=UPI000BD9FCAD|nr:hypothetical protein [Sediminibacterium sp.]OYZ55716.1 MAG: hypothetical protein B7Y11_01240 [Sphingobacteriia bacterium 24-36-13]HQS23209.1 hypothetical protein [Sediminibacterium sp.]